MLNINIETFSDSDICVMKCAKPLALDAMLQAILIMYAIIMHEFTHAHCKRNCYVYRVPQLT